MKSPMPTKLATAKSWISSPSKSPTATDDGANPTGTSSAAVNVPSPTPRRIETKVSPLLTTAKSWIASPSKSPTATEIESSPTGTSSAAVNVPSPFPSRIETKVSPMFVTAKSWPCCGGIGGGVGFKSKHVSSIPNDTCTFPVI